MAGICADIVRKLEILQTTTAMFDTRSETWEVDMKLIAEAKASDLENMQTILAREHSTDVATLTRMARGQNILGLYKALKYITFQPSNIPLTQGYK